MKKYVLSNLIFFICLASFNAGCTNLGTFGSAPKNVELEERSGVVRVFYATDRQMVESADPSLVFNSKRSTLSYGHCDVKIPRDHRLGELEQASIFKLEFKDDPDKHVTLLKTVPLQLDEFKKSISDQAKNSSNREAIVFIHGYYTSFADAAKRTAQMKYDLAFAGPSVFFSWPSKGTLMGYPSDEADIEWAASDLQIIIEDLAKNKSISKIHLIAHSMGNRGLLSALRQIESKGDKSTYAKLHEIILAAPDVDADTFKKDIFPQIAKNKSHVTLYASKSDIALRLSKQLHQYTRTGSTIDELLSLKQLDIIDASTVKYDFLGHSYFGEKSVMSDIFYLLHERKPANERFFLEPVQTQSGMYYRFR